MKKLKFILPNGIEIYGAPEFIKPFAEAAERVQKSNNTKGGRNTRRSRKSGKPASKSEKTKPRKDTHKAVRQTNPKRKEGNSELAS